jgi:hypothetical protein
MVTAHTSEKKTVTERTTLPLPKNDLTFGGWGPRVTY